MEWFVQVIAHHTAVIWIANGISPQMHLWNFRFLGSTQRLLSISWMCTMDHHRPLLWLDDLVVLPFLRPLQALQAVCMWPLHQIAQEITTDLSRHIEVWFNICHIFRFDVYVFVWEIARPRVQFVINRYEWFWKFSKLHEPLDECLFRILKITSTYYSRIVREGRVIFFIYSTFNKITSFPWKLNRYSYGVQFGIDCTALDQSNLSNFVECTINNLIINN